MQYLDISIVPTSTGSSKKQESSRKTSISALLIAPKPLTVWITKNGKILYHISLQGNTFIYYLSLINY